MQVKNLALAPPTGSKLLPCNGAFATHFNRSDFLFDHGLAHHPLFELTALRELAERIPKYKNFVYWQNGSVAQAASWAANPARRLSLDETLAGIASNDSLVVLKHADQDSVYGPVLQEILQRIYDFSSPALQADIVLGESLIFINSPKRKTVYHLDLESNFLLQVTGEKLVYVFDHADRSLTPHSELEDHCCGNINGAIYKSDRQNDAHFYHLTPGHGVHFPSTAPHWVHNGDQVSVSININFDLVSVHDRLRRIYRMNRTIRRLGFDPKGPGTSPVRDAMKTSVSRSVSFALDLARRIKKNQDAGTSYPMWRPNRTA